LTARQTCRADAKAELSDPTAIFTYLLVCKIFVGRPETSDKSYPGDNRLVRFKSSYRRPRSAPRCRLTLSWRWRSFQGFGCSPIKRVRELGL